LLQNDRRRIVISPEGRNIKMMRVVLGAAVCAMVLAGAGIAARADGAISSPADLDSGAANWQYISPHSSTATQPAEPITNVSVPQTTTRTVTKIDDNLSIEAPPPPPPRKPTQPLWYSQQPGK
jgi:hypothetical protein